MIFFSILCRHGVSFLGFDRFTLLFRISRHAILKKQTFLYRLIVSFVFRSFLSLLIRSNNQRARMHLLFFIKIKNLRGMRHIFNLPVNGQRSKTNASTRRRLKNNTALA